MTTLLTPARVRTLALTALALAGLTSTARASVDHHDLPGATAFPEGLAAGHGGSFFTGSVVDGTIFTGTLDTTTATVFSPAGADGRAAAAGMEVDRQNRLWVAGAGTGKLFVYDVATRTLRHTFVLAAPNSGTVNDLVVARDGNVYVTDSSTPRLWRVPIAAADAPGTTTQTPWLRVGAPIEYRSGDSVAGVNLNGIGVAPSGRALEIVQTNVGKLWRIDTRTRKITQVQVSGGDLTYGDGLISEGQRLLVARNVERQVLVLRMRRDGRRATVTATIQRPAFAFPTAVALVKDRLLVANAQLDKAAGTPQLPFTVSDLPAP